MISKKRMTEIRQELTDISDELKNDVSFEFNKTKDYSNCENENQVRYLLDCSVRYIDNKKAFSTTYKSLDSESKKHLDNFFESFAAYFLRNEEKNHESILDSICLDSIQECFSDTFCTDNDIESVICE